MRILGIIFASLVVMLAAVLLLAFSLCAFASNFGSSEKNTFLLLDAIDLAVLIAGIYIIARLAKRISASRRIPSQPPSPELPINSTDRKAIDQLLIAIIAELVLAILSWSLHSNRGVLHYWPAMLATFVLYQSPYVFLLWRLNKKPNRFSIALALVVPAASFFSSMFALLTVLRLAVDHLRSVATTVIFAAIDVVIFVLALRVAKLRSPPNLHETILITGAGVFVYFLIAHFLSPWLYRFF